MNILVTGGAGFIGSHLCEALLRRGERVIAVDDFNDYYDPAMKRENVAGLLESPGFKLHEADIRDRKALDGIVAEDPPHAVCHLAARAGVRPSIKDPVLYEEVNAKGTLNLLEALRGLKLKNFVFASSSSVYGINSKLPFSEDDPIASTISPYAASKRACELYLYAHSHLHSVPVTCLRFFTVYGERGRPDMAVARFTRHIYEGREVPVYGDGTAKRDFTYIGDIISGVVKSVYTPFPYEVINIGGSRTVEVSGLISIIEQSLGKRAKVRNLASMPGDPPVTSADVSKAERLLGFRPSVSIEDGVGRYVKWFLKREEGLSPA